MDERLRTAGRAARAEIEADVDVDAAWRDVQARLTVGDDLTDNRSELAMRRAARDRRWVALSAAAAAVVLIAGVAFLVRRPESITSTVPTTLEPVTTPATVSTVPTSSAPPGSVTSNTDPVTTSASTLAPPAPPDDPSAIAVSYLDPPPDATVTLLGSDSLAVEEIDRAGYLVGELGVARLLDGSVTVIGFDGTVRDVTLTENAPRDLRVYGPGDVLYGLRWTGETPPVVSAAAVALSGDRAGSVVASSGELGSLGYLELPAVAFGHGRTGVVNLDSGGPDDGRVVLEYVDNAGNPIDWPDAPTAASLTDDGRQVRQGDLSWQLAIERHPAWAFPFTGENGAAAGPDGTVVYPTTIGEALDEAVYPDPLTAQPVVAVLRPDGSGQFLGVPDGWRVSSISPWGVLVTRPDSAMGIVELGLLDVSVPPIDPLTELATEDTGVAAACVDEFTCTQVAIDADGTVVSFDPTNNMLTRHGEQPISAQVETPAFTSLIAAGPDGVVYLNEQSPGIDDPVGDLVAVSLVDGDAGREIRRVSGAVDRSGDTALVAVSGGFVQVGCCGPDTVRPDPDATAAYPWVDRAGNDTTADLPVVRWDTAARIVTVGDQAWPLDLADDAGFRGMPEILPLPGGGFTGAFASIDGARITLVRGHADGHVEQIDVSRYPAALALDGRFWFVDRDAARLVVTDPWAP